MPWPHHASSQPTHRSGELGITTEYARLHRPEFLSLALPLELRGVVRLAVLLLASPLVLAASYFVAQWGVEDLVMSDHSGFLILWGCFAVAFASSQLISRSLRLILVRSFLLRLVIAATVGIGIGNAYLAQRAHADAEAGKPERVFRYVAGSKKTMFGRSPVLRHQRADGTDIEGLSKLPRLAHGHCITAQPVQGTYGFRWLRVTEKIPPLRPGQLGWLVRRADCFSEKPLSKLV